MGRKNAKGDAQANTENANTEKENGILTDNATAEDAQATTENANTENEKGILTENTAADDSQASTEYANTRKETDISTESAAAEDGKNKQLALHDTAQKIDILHPRESDRVERVLRSQDATTSGDKGKRKAVMLVHDKALTDAVRIHGQGNAVLIVPKKENMQSSAQEREGHNRLNREYFDSFPPGVRFSPTGLELIEDYLKKKLFGFDLPRNKFCTDNVYKCHPQELTEKHEPVQGNEWYFFTPRQKKGNLQADRYAGPGFWKASRANEEIDNDIKRTVGTKQSFIYYEGTHKDNPKQTPWHMDEYKYVGENDGNQQVIDCVLSKIFKRTIQSKEKMDIQQEEQLPYPTLPPNFAEQGQRNESFIYLTEDVLCENPFLIPGSCKSSHLSFSEFDFEQYFSEASGDHIHRESTAGGTTDVRSEARNRGDNSNKVEAATLASVEIEEGETAESDQAMQKSIESEKGNTEDGKGGGKS